MTTQITIPQMLAVNAALQAEWHKDTGNALCTDEFWGRAFATSLGATGNGMVNAAIVQAHCLGDKAIRQYDDSSTLEDCNRSAKHYARICRKALENAA